MLIVSCPCTSDQRSGSKLTASNSAAEMVLVLTVDARTLVGKLLSCDQMTNLVCYHSPIIFQSPADCVLGNNAYYDCYELALTTQQVLQNTRERIIRPADDEEPTTEVSHGLYIVRGDNVAVVGLVDEELDESINWSEVRGEIIERVRHGA